MNRLSMYFENAKLAKACYIQAQEEAAKGELWKAVRDLSKGMEYLQAAMNNVASIGFNTKPKARKK